MKVDVYCFNCIDDPDDVNLEQVPTMQPEGDLYINEEKTQTQAYECPDCGIKVLVSINTLKE